MLRMSCNKSQKSRYIYKICIYSTLHVCNGTDAARLHVQTGPRFTMPRCGVHDKTIEPVILILFLAFQRRDVGEEPHLCNQ
ncbi:hypothetical protein AcW1_005827 [Taiwanofungus camphoratus]|nr:hypothetical protein AcW1_005827 [Antrodia cinnamomea]